MKVLIADKMSPRAAEILRHRGITTDERVGLERGELAACIGEYDGLVVRSATKATANVLESADRLKVIGRAGIGVDNVDVAAATSRGIVVMNTPFGNAITTAEHAVAMMMAMVRQIPTANMSTKSGKWEKSRFMGVELASKTLGIIGCGNIGSIVADRAIGLKMKVISHDPYLSEEHAVDLGVEKVDLDTLFGRADIITLHTPMTEQTRNIINRDTIAKMKAGVRIVNCARGGLVVEDDLRAALETGHVAGAALDVFEEEPATENPLLQFDNVVATPHLGASTTEAQENVAVQIAEQIADYLLSGAIVNALNMPAVTAEEAPRLTPYMHLSELIGSFAGQLTQSALQSVTIEYEGHAAELNTRPMTAAALCGLLAPQMDSVNMVNAPVVAHERGIDVSEVRHERPCDYQTLVRVTVTTEKQTRGVAGSLFGGQPRVVDIKGVAVEAELRGNMLYITNKDRPGLIGEVGSILGNSGINIASFHLGRAEPGGDAIALIATDNGVPGNILRAVSALPNVVQAVPLVF